MVLSIKERKDNLKILNNLLENEKTSICQALYNDLHKPEFESIYLEIKQVQHEIQYHLDNLDEWISEKIFINPLRYLTLFLTGYGQAYIESKPRGNSLIIGAWNYPINLTLLPLVGSISAGNNTIIVFPALDYTPNTSKLLVKLFNKYFDNRYIKAEIGGKENVERLLEIKWDFIFFTGSSAVGKSIYQQAAKQLTPVVLELGGKSPCIVDEQSNMKLLIKRMLWGKLTNCGQTCISPDYFLVSKKYGTEFVKLMIDSIKEFYKDIKNSKDYGRIVNNRAFKRLSNIINVDSNFIEYGGNLDIDKLYIQPTIINFNDNIEAFINSECMKDELFGPIIPIYLYDNITEASNIIKKYPDPLVVYLFTKEWKSIEKEIKAGSIVVNDTLIQMSSPLPFGGIGNSGIGQYHGKKTFDIFSYQISKLVRYKYGELAVRFPPYNVQWKKLMIRFSQMIFSTKYLNKSLCYIKNILIIYLIFFYFTH
jgi:aldehyde dehydrogenase (NAD+)